MVEGPEIIQLCQYLARTKVTLSLMLILNDKLSYVMSMEKNQWLLPYYTKQEPLKGNV